MFIITQLTAAVGAVIFGFAQDRFGAIKAFNITMVLWVVAILLIYYTNSLTQSLNDSFSLSLKPENLFIVIGSLAGLGLGSTQSAARAMVGIFSPESKSGEFFGFWGLAGKLSAIFGLLGLGILQTQFGLHRAILFTAILFVFAFFMTFMVDEKRGREKAKVHEGD
jgi:UMF1 family MFS transporter